VDESGGSILEEHVKAFVEATEQLERLKAAVQSQQQSSNTIALLAQGMQEVAQHLSRTPIALQASQDRVEAIAQQLDSAVQQASALQASIPAIVERIEASDMAQAIAASNAQLQRGQAAIAEYRTAVGELEKIVEALAAAQRESMRSLTEEIARGVFAQLQTSQTVEANRREMLSRVDRLESTVAAIAKTNEAAVEVSLSTMREFKAMMTAFGAQHGQALGEIRTALAELRTAQHDVLERDVAVALGKLDEHSRMLEVLSKRRGLIF